MGIRLDGTALLCGGCDQVVYSDCRVLANHVVRTLPDGRVHWWSEDFMMTVHLCGTNFAELPAGAQAVERLAGVLLAILRPHAAAGL